MPAPLEQPRYLIDPYLDWVKKEGIPVAEDYALDLFAVPTGDWPRFGVKGAAAHVKGRGDFASMFALDIPPGKSTPQQQHLYEEVIYILAGSGSHDSSVNPAMVRRSCAEYTIADSALQKSNNS